MSYVGSEVRLLVHELLACLRCGLPQATVTFTGRKLRLDCRSSAVYCCDGYPNLLGPLQRIRLAEKIKHVGSITHMALRKQWQRCFACNQGES